MGINRYNALVAKETCYSGTRRKQLQQKLYPTLRPKVVTNNSATASQTHNLYNNDNIPNQQINTNGKTHAEVIRTH